MSLTVAGPDVLQLLHQQHNLYTIELSRTRQTLRKLYKKLSKADRMLAERQERELSRSDKKKHQYSRVLSKKAAAGLECQQASLYDALRQCDDLIAAYTAESFITPMTPWTAQFPPSPVFTPYSPPMFSPWAVSPHGPQYWDLSMFPRSDKSTQGLPNDSNFFDSAVHGVPYQQFFDTSNQEGTYDTMPTIVHSTPSKSCVNARSKSRSTPGQDHSLLTLVTQVSPVKLGLEGPRHKRFFSADAIQTDEDMMATAHSRVASRTGSI